MSILGDKQEIFDKIGALKTLNEGLPSFNVSNSMSSVNNSDNTIDFLLDLLKTLIGLNGIRTQVENFLTYNLPEVEKEMKDLLKNLIKEFVACGSNPRIPNYLLNQNAGLNTSIKKVDFFNIFYTDPKSQLGSLLYNDPNTGLASSDLNTFLYETLQQSLTPQDWTGANSNPVLTFTFRENGVTTNNELNVKASAYYSNPANNKRLIDLLNDFVDSVSLFEPDKIISGIIDILYGTVSFDSNKSQSQLASEQELDTLINNLLAEDSDDLDDSYFQFSSDEIVNIEELSGQRKGGIRKLKDCNNLESGVEVNTLLDGTSGILTATTATEIKTNIGDLLNDIGDDASSNASNSDTNNIKLNFIEEMVKSLAKSIVNTIISPKLMVLFWINYVVIHEQTGEPLWDDPTTFLIKNKKIIKQITNKARDIITAFLLSVVIKIITELVAQQLVGDLKEKANNQKAQLLSLFGVPQDVLRLITNLR